MKIYIVWPVRVELPWISSAQCTTCNDCWNTSKEKCFHTQINLSQVQGYFLTLPGRGARILIIWHVTSVQEMFCFSGCKSESKKKEAKLKKIKKKICWMWLKSQTTKCGERDQRKSQDLSHHLLLIQKKKKKMYTVIWYLFHSLTHRHTHTLKIWAATLQTNIYITWKAQGARREWEQEGQRPSRK